MPTLPQTEGRWTPEEAQAWQDAISPANLAFDKDIAEAGIKFNQSIMQEWTERTRPLHRRWRATHYMLSGNTLERGGPEDIHVPEIYKALETMVPRLEEVVLDKEPWFGVIPRKQASRYKADSMAAYMDWQFSQAKVRSKVQPAIRNMLITQCAAFYCYWDNVESMRTVREVDQSFDKNGKLTRKVKFTRKKVIDYSGPRVNLVDPFDFIIDSKATDPQNAVYVGHRAYVTIDEIRRLGKQFGWANLDMLSQNNGSSFGMEQDTYKWARDPAARVGDVNNRRQPKDGRPEKLEMVVLYSKWSHDGGETYSDYRFVTVGGKIILEISENQEEGGMRPYATMRVTNGGHEFYGIGPFDNAIRINQHIDRYHQLFLRAAAVSAGPIVFAEEDSDLPDSLYHVRPFQVYKGVGPVRFTQIPDGVIRAAPLVLGTLQKNLEETVGAFRINMGQDSGGTATEASLSLQEGNRRMRSHVRAIGDGLDQLLHIFHRFNLRYSTEDVEFPVLGKRALSLKKDYLNFGPADLLDDVEFELVGLKTSRNYGLKTTGMMSFVNSMTPFIVGNPNAVDQVAIMHDAASELVGVDVADRWVRIPTPIEQLRSQEEENEGLVQGAEIEIDKDDDHKQHLKDIEPLYRRALDDRDSMPLDVRRVIIQHREQHRFALMREAAQEKAKQERMSSAQAPAEAGGQTNPETGRSSPVAGGVSDAMNSLANEPQDGQTPGQNPGPADERKYGRPGRRTRTVNQTEDRND